MGKAQFGTIVRRARGRTGLTLRDVAARTGIDFTRLSRIEHGTRPAPGLSEIRTLADLLKLDMVDLLVAAGTAREVMEALLWTERLHVAASEPTLRPYAPEIASLESKNTFRVEVREREGGLCRVSLGEELLTVVSFSTAGSLRIEVPPQAITVIPGRLASLLADYENALCVKVAKIRRLGQLVNLVLSGRGYELNSLQTGMKTDPFGVKKDDGVLAIVPATVIRTSPIEEGH